MNNDITYTICPQCEKLVQLDVIEAQLEQACCEFCNCALPMSGVVSELNDQTLRLLIKHAEKPVVVDFYAGWCAPCKQYSPLFSKFADSNYADFIFGKISTEFNPVLAQSYNIKGIPHTLCFVDGQELGRKVGVLSNKQIEEFIANCLK